MSFLVIEAVGDLVLRGAEGLDKIALVFVNKDILVSILHPLFQVGDSTYEDGPGELLTIRGKIPDDMFPVIVRIEAIHFASDSSFVGTPLLELEGYLAGFTYSLLRDFKENAHQPVVESGDDGVCLIETRILAFVPCATAEITLDQGPCLPITEVISFAVAILGLQDRVFDPALKWMQASFTAQADGTYAGHCQFPENVRSTRSTRRTGH